MHIPLQYMYLIGAIISLIPSAIVFIFRKDLRKEMIVMGVLFMICAVVVEYFFWTVDYWKPLTITKTRIGIEDFILGFANGSFIPVVYDVIFRQRHINSDKKIDIAPWEVVFLMAVMLCSLIFLIHTTSAVATVITLLFGTLIVVWQRKDLLFYALAAGILLTIVYIPIYLILEYVSPTFVDKTWLFTYLSNIRLLGIPIEDVLYYFSLAAFLGAFYLYWKREAVRVIRVVL